MFALESEEIRGLTLWRPWPEAIIKGHKRIENRPWKLPQWARRILVALHGGIHYDKAGAEWMRDRGLYKPGDTQGDSPSGILAVCRFSDCVTQSTDPWFMGPYGWTISDLWVLPERITCRGWQGFWRLPEEVERQVRLGLKEAKKR